MVHNPSTFLFMCDILFQQNLNPLFLFTCHILPKKRNTPLTDQLVTISFCQASKVIHLFIFQGSGSIPGTSGSLCWDQ